MYIEMAFQSVVFVVHGTNEEKPEKVYLFVSAYTFKPSVLSYSFIAALIAHKF